MTARQEALDAVTSLRNRLMATATNDTVRTKLANLDDACRIVVLEAAQRPTVPGVVKRYKAAVVEPKMNLAEQSLRNKRSGANPYAALYAAWQGTAEVVLASAWEHRQRSSPNEILSLDDLAGINDAPLRHQVSLVVAQNRSLKAQLDILKQTLGESVVRLVGAQEADAGGGGEAADHLALTDSEVEAVRCFLDSRRMNARGLKAREDGAIETIDGRRLTEPDFWGALEKIAKSYQA
jgi:hypothetical protein